MVPQVGRCSGEAVSCGAGRDQRPLAAGSRLRVGRDDHLTGNIIRAAILCALRV